MGHLIGDKKAVDVTVPAGTYSHGDLYRISGFTGFLINDVTSGATDRNRSLEIAVNRAWKIKLPSGITPAVGDHLDWSSGAGTKRGDTDLVIAAAAQTGPPAVPANTGVCKVVTAKNANGYAEVILTEQRPNV